MELWPARFYVTKARRNLLEASQKTAIDGFGKGVAFCPLFENNA